MSVPGRRLTRGHITSGFTLVELQIALVLMGMIVLLMTSAIRATTQTWEKATARQDVAEHQFMLEQFLRRLLNNMRFMPTPLENRQTVSSFYGESDYLGFVAPFPVYANDGALYWWTLKSRRDEQSGKEQLILEYLPFVSGEVVDIDPHRGLIVPDEVPSTIVVAEGISIEKVEYYSVPLIGTPEWVDEWRPQNNAPKVISIQLMEGDPDKSSSEPLLFALAPQFYNQRVDIAPNER